MPTALLLSNDLFFASRIKSAAKTAAIELSIAQSIERTSLDDSFQIVIADLAATSDSPESIARRFRESDAPVTLIAFGPHVQTARLQAATEAGFDSVLTRGQLDRDLGQLFR